jgi:4'-phosphopantetheinyl transferase
MSGEADARMSSTDVHVYSFNLLIVSVDHDHAYSLLSEDERVRASRFHFEKDQKQFVQSRALLRLVLAKHLGCDVKTIEFKYGEKGKPSLKTNSSDGLHFNVSHSGEIVCIAVCYDHQVGIDVELINAEIDTESIASTYFTEDEVRLLESASMENRVKLFFRLWVRKEAFIKAVGMGFSFPIDQLTVGDSDGVKITLNGTSSEIIDPEEWISKDFEVDDGYVATVFVNGDACTFVFIENEMILRS